MARRVKAGAAFAIAYLDLDNFKAFADSFGFAAADQVIRETGRALHAAVSATGTATDFVGHIGGDDFLVITSAADAERVATECARRFRDAIGLVLGADAVARETFSGVDREGSTREFPIARLSAAILHVASGRKHTLTQLAERASELKRQAKQRGAGTIVSAVV
jgi:diguanylate cyclase (GGDEF)-like protein